MGLVAVMCKIFKNNIVLFCIFLFCNTLFSQDNNVLIKGVVLDIDNNPIEGVNISLENLNIKSITNKEGFYKLTVPYAVVYKVFFSHIGYDTVISEIEFTDNIREYTLNAQMIDTTVLIDGIDIVSKSAIDKVKESEYSVSALDLKAFKNSSIDLSKALDKVSGVKVMQDGGVGSKSNISLNGFSGNHVKVFIDGVPMESFGPNFQINNIPVNFAETIEVYKGVVPTNLSTDALGGVVNIITKKSIKKFLEISYSLGSFNTHKSNLNTAYKFDNGISLYLNAFQNYSDNSYYVKAKVLDFKTGVYSKEKRKVKRFHDTYHNETIIFRAGIEDKSFADKLLIGFTWGNLYDEIQHAADMDKVFGDKFRRSKTLMPSIFYKKDNLFTDRLDFTLTANYNFGESQNTDIGNKRYNWLGQSEIKANNRLGEQRYSDYLYKNNNGLITANSSYEFLENHSIVINDTYTVFNRIGYDKYREFFTKLPTKMNKNIFGASYKYVYNQIWSTSLFYKKYINSVEAYYTTQNNKEAKTFSKETSVDGGGLATVYNFNPNLQFKASFEKTFRLPTSREYFGIGDGIEIQNPNLKPESSNNLNIGSNVKHTFNKEHNIVIDISYGHRKAKDFIKRELDTNLGVIVAKNYGLVQINAVDTELRYTYKEFLSIGSNITYQDIKNKNKEEYFYNERLANLPYFFCNGDISLNFKNIYSTDNILNVSLYTNYIQSFTNDWDVYLSSPKIPSQLTLDLLVNFAFNDAKYNISLECNNITNTDVYDNYNLQKPGRSFSLKCRLFI